MVIVGWETFITASHGLPATGRSTNAVVSFSVDSRFGHIAIWRCPGDGCQAGPMARKNARAVSIIGCLRPFRASLPAPSSPAQPADILQAKNVIVIGGASWDSSETS